MIHSPIFFTILVLLFHFQHSLSFSLSVERHENDFIVSPKGTFTAGFYPVGENAYSFAIWFTQKHKNLTNATVVWMANREQPVNGKRSTLSLLNTGNLILTDAGQFNVWSTNTYSLKQLELVLYDTGNLILREHNTNGFILWQSFDFPTDTLLPDQSFTRYMNLVSSKRDTTNYSSSCYKLFFDNDNLLRLLYDGPGDSSVYWPDPLFLDWQDSRSMYNHNRVATLNRLGNFSSSDNFTFITSDYGTVLQRRLTLDFDGNVRVYSRKQGQEKWLVSGQFVQQPCQIHGICGPNSTCSYGPIKGRKCSCLPGYSIINNQDWSQGCKPSFQFSCNNKTEYRFKFLPRVKFNSYNYGFHKNYTYKQCKHICLQMCECIAFQFRYIKKKGVNNCYPKTQLLNGLRSTEFKGSLFLKLPKNNIVLTPEYDNLVCSRNNGIKQLQRLYVGEKENGLVNFMLMFASGLGGIEVLCFFLVGCILFKNRKQSSVDNHGYVIASATGFRKFSYSELKKATKGFSQEIGRGAGGTVYKGILSDDRVVAIKRLHDTNQGDSEFLAEVSIIGRLNHMNLIGMWGYCAEGKHKLLVYEYMENGTLADNLSSNELDWGKRYGIAIGTAKCLAYLHEECLEWILHCDIKPQNILVDSDYRPKVADFGLSKLLNRNEHDNSNFSRIRGTRGYMAPEWVFNMQITSKVDVYSYGVVVLEMITGKSPTTGIQIKDKEELYHERLVTWVREKRRKVLEVACWVEEIVDPALGSNYDAKRMETLANVALDCVQEDKDVRPTMSQVVERLS
ncbi:Serine/Threonine kinase, plant-type protein [Medicago truncatula]|uniref:Receptor-like serine/threonine-protein kinase n=1 Tax=Medicago truncatula TaxID=3880 RepID=G7J0P5_MEDTR|nr:Serine/Threonine kinase, plant-type protein [Medicago truncatula]